ncbi:XRE family transcriptional regulator [Rhodococcus sp. USK13]|uniref:XRE family transcriptional regulator n=1 Tax=Rhodococcus sp. USK13 TaxID=2806442 RepID=UPI001BD020D4|nr:XRE family transcriptional regulator [Rhodococcus sp. USK13]
MARSPEAPVEPDTIVAARISTGHDVESAAKKLGVAPEKLNSWELGDARPTLAQARNMAKLYGTTIAALLTNIEANFEPVPRLPDFRRDHDRPVTTAVIGELRKARDRRKRLLELSGPTGEFPRLDLRRSSIEEVANEVRRLTGVSIDDQRKFRDAGAALNGWIRAVERLGVLVFQVSRIPTSEFLGMSYYEELQPIILLNGADIPQRRIFTLFHELGHLLSRTSGICDIYSGGASESTCNAFAAAFLLPEAALLAALGHQEPIGALDRLSKHFRVSQSAVAVRLRELGRISARELSRQLAIAREKAQAPREPSDNAGFVPPYVLKLRNLGETYVSSVLDAMHEGTISAVDASYFLDAKLPTIDKMEREIAKRAVGQ